MHQRHELEQAHTLAEMQEIIDTFENDLDEYSNTEVRCRIGIAKDLIEEYYPLFLLARRLPGFKTARLTPESNPGPDAVLLFDDGSQATVQITCAGENESTAARRELLNGGKIVFANQSVNRNPKTRKFTQSGRILTSKAANTLAVVEEVVLAVKKKTDKYRAGTQFLLIGIHRSEISMTDDWWEQLRAAVTTLPNLPYDRVYVTSGDNCFVVLP